MSSSLLLEIGMSFLGTGSGLRVEAQALNGLRLWLRHFDRVTLCATVMSETTSNASLVWADPAPLLSTGRLAFEPLPWGYRVDQHFRHRGSVRSRYASLIKEHRYLCFSNIGGLGAWGVIGATEAARQRRSYSLWFDWVIHAMGPSVGSRWNPLAWKRRAEALKSDLDTRRVIEGAALGLFHGQTVYDAYAPWCRQPALVHDVHVHPEDAIDDSSIATKLAELHVDSVLRLGYVGRVHPTKAPFDWVRAIAKTCAVLGKHRVQATWLGDGPLLKDIRQHVRELGLEGQISFPGFVSDRPTILAFLQRQHAMPFCHIKPESPRCLIEALISATPLVGYDSAYVRELTDNRGGAMLSPNGDPEALASNLIRLAEPDLLRRLISEAGTTRNDYNDEAVFAHRSELIKKYL